MLVDNSRSSVLKDRAYHTLVGLVLLLLQGIGIIGTTLITRMIFWGIAKSTGEEFPHFVSRITYYIEGIVGVALALYTAVLHLTDFGSVVKDRVSEMKQKAILEHHVANPVG